MCNDTKNNIGDYPLLKINANDFLLTIKDIDEKPFSKVKTILCILQQVLLSNEFWSTAIKKPPSQ